MYSHLCGLALSSTMAPIPINMEIKCLFHSHLGSCRYLAVQRAEVGGTVLMSHWASSRVPCVTAEKMEVSCRHTEAGPTWLGISSVCIGIHCLSFSDMPPEHPRFLWGHYYSAFLWLKPPLAIFCKLKGGRGGCKTPERIHRSLNCETSAKWKKKQNGHSDLQQKEAAVNFFSLWL